jgi:hypothetical protein
MIKTAIRARGNNSMMTGIPPTLIVVRSGTPLIITVT